MPEITVEISALEELPEFATVELGGGHDGGGDGGCGLITCVVTCVLSIL